MITVLCPILNEEKNITNILNFFINSKPDDKELYLIDGGSKDKTIEIVKRWIINHDNIFLLNNPKKYVSFALNLGIKKSTGDPIIRLDAHTIYEKDYLEEILKTFKKSGADIVGGPMRATGKTHFQKAVAYATSTIFGIGGSKIHNEEYEGNTDHVYLGAWKRKVFEDIGYFNEKLNRNQDDEFHYRAKSLGKIIYQNPIIRSYYFPRSNALELFSQYFQYGLFKPLVLQSVKSGFKLRHIIPSLYVIFLIISLFTIYLIPMLILQIIYLFLLCCFSFCNNLPLVEKLQLLVIYPVLHCSYGTGFIIGVKRLFT